MKAIISPSILKGNITPVSSKSMIHRALILATITRGKTKIVDVDMSGDVADSIRVCQLLGLEIKEEGRDLIVKSKGFNHNIKIDEKVVIKESASTLRFFIPLLMLLNNGCIIEVGESLSKRPIDVYLDLFKGSITKEGNLIKLNHCDLAEFIELNDNSSSQYISGLIFAYLASKNDYRIKLNKIVSLPYFNMTIEMARLFGARVSLENGEVIIGCSNLVCPKVINIEKDYSSASVFLALKEAGCNINVLGLTYGSLQGDKVILDLLKEDDHYDLDLTDIPDLGPILFARASTLKSLSRFRSTNRLELKESARLSMMKLELAKFGVRLDLLDNEVIVYPKLELNCNEYLDSHNDHRICMALIYLAVISRQECEIRGIECLNKSYPNMLVDLINIGLNVEIED